MNPVPSITEIVDELRRTTKIERPDCGDSSCRFASERGGMRTNGGCRCFVYSRPDARLYLLKIHAACSPEKILALCEDWEELNWFRSEVNKRVIPGEADTGDAVNHMIREYAAARVALNKLQTALRDKKS